MADYMCPFTGGPCVFTEDVDVNEVSQRMPRIPFERFIGEEERFRRPGCRGAFRRGFELGFREGFEEGFELGLRECRRRRRF